MSGKNIIFDDEKINKSSFYKGKKLFDIYEIDVNKILVSKKEPYGKKSLLKYFIGSDNHNNYFGPLCIRLPQIIGYVKHFDSNKTTFKSLSRLLIMSY